MKKLNSEKKLESLTFVHIASTFFFNFSHYFHFILNIHLCLYALYYKIAHIFCVSLFAQPHQLLIMVTDNAYISIITVVIIITTLLITLFKKNCSSAIGVHALGRRTSKLGQIKCLSTWLYLFSNYLFFITFSFSPRLAHFFSCEVQL